MNRKSIDSHSHLYRCRCRRRGPVVERAIAARLAIVARIVSRSRIGRPLTPMSYAGVARRTTRRAVVGGAVVGGAVAAGAYYAAPACSQVVDAYGRIVTVCP